MARLERQHCGDKWNNNSTPGIVATGLSDLTFTWSKSARNGINLGLFPDQISEIWYEKVPDLSNFGHIWRNFGPALTPWVWKTRLCVMGLKVTSQPDSPDRDGKKSITWINRIIAFTLPGKLKIKLRNFQIYYSFLALLPRKRVTSFIFWSQDSDIDSDVLLSVCIMSGFGNRL